MEMLVWIAAGLVALIYVLMKLRFHVTDPKFAHQRVWITGASSGIGEHLAVAFAKAGASLILSSRNAAELTRVQHICREFTAEVDVVPIDLSSPQEAMYTARQVATRYDIDILVNNAGVSQRVPLTSSLNTMELERKLFAVNYLGTVAVTKAVLPRMIQRKRGHIVLISSVAGLLEAPLRCFYGASKAAASAYMESLRCEVWRHGIAVTNIYPGFVQTNISANALGAEGAYARSRDSNISKGMATSDFTTEAMRHIYYRHEEVVIAQPGTLAFLYVKKHLPSLYSLLAPWGFLRMEAAFRRDNFA